jgi:hypothetical protein
VREADLIDGSVLSTYLLFGIPLADFRLIALGEAFMANQERPAQNRKDRHVVDDAQSPFNESQRDPGGSGDPRMPRAVGVPLPWGGQTDTLHPVDQPAGDTSDPASERRPHRKGKKSA